MFKPAKTGSKSDDPERLLDRLPLGFRHHTLRKHNRMNSVNYKKIMRHLAIILSLIWFIACNTAPNQSGNSQKMVQESDLNNTSLDSIQNLLINSAATDFLKNRPPTPLRFRDVRIGHLTGSNGIRRYILCGQFLPSEQKDKAEWIPFVTIKTDPYEQWLGNQASAYCNDTSVVWENMSDLSSFLQSRLDSLR